MNTRPHHTFLLISPSLSLTVFRRVRGTFDDVTTRGFTCAASPLPPSLPLTFSPTPIPPRPHARGGRVQAVARVCDDVRTAAGESDIAERIYRGHYTSSRADFAASLCGKMTPGSFPPSSLCFTSSPAFSLSLFHTQSDRIHGHTGTDWMHTFSSSLSLHLPRALSLFLIHAHTPIRAHVCVGGQCASSRGRS